MGLGRLHWPPPGPVGRGRHWATTGPRGGAPGNSCTPSSPSEDPEGERREAHTRAHPHRDRQRPPETARDTGGRAEEGGKGRANTHTHTHCSAPLHSCCQAPWLPAHPTPKLSQLPSLPFSTSPLLLLPPPTSPISFSPPRRRLSASRFLSSSSFIIWHWTSPFTLLRQSSHILLICISCPLQTSLWASFFHCFHTRPPPHTPFHPVRRSDSRTNQLFRILNHTLSCLDQLALSFIEAESDLHSQELLAREPRASSHTQFETTGLSVHGHTYHSHPPTQSQARHLIDCSVVSLVTPQRQRS